MIGTMGKTNACLDSSVVISRISAAQSNSGI
jgi:hypothetical protein